ncbi:ABC transporter substrate-binding protein [Streptomyces sp. NPDC091212]|uniref:ABC transporter substrate-binding protein n=1 Tax=Streptomyces sp. NPDC091212 TaxID=3155191 RepID=UPI0034385BCC
MIGSGRTGVPAAPRYRLGGADLSKSLGGSVVSWPSGFTASLPVMQAFKSGSVDFSFATAVIYGAADLKGKRIADQQGTTGTYSLIKYLETAGLRVDDVSYVNLAAADAESAFANGKVDAWISGHYREVVEITEREGLTLRELGKRYGGRTEGSFIGTASEVADGLERSESGAWHARRHGKGA